MAAFPYFLIVSRQSISGRSSQKSWDNIQLCPHLFPCGSHDHCRRISSRGEQRGLAFCQRLTRHPSHLIESWDTGLLLAIDWIEAPWSHSPSSFPLQFSAILYVYPSREVGSNVRPSAIGSKIPHLEFLILHFSERGRSTSPPHAPFIMTNPPTHHKYTFRSGITTHIWKFGVKSASLQPIPELATGHLTHHGLTRWDPRWSLHRLVIASTGIGTRECCVRTYLDSMPVFATFVSIESLLSFLTLHRIGILYLMLHVHCHRAPIRVGIYIRWRHSFCSTVLGSKE